MPFNFDPVPPAEALAFFRAKGWQLAFDHRDVWQAENAVAFTVAKATELDVLASIRFEVDKALNDGLPFSTFKESLQPTLERLGWWGRDKVLDRETGALEEAQLGSPARLRTIYRTNLRTARAAGQWARIDATQETHPYLLYRLGPSRIHREQHVRWDGLMLRANDPWWQTHYPPNGWGCKCRVRQVSGAEADRRSLRVNEAPPIRRTRRVNTRTGQIDRVPEGIDAGWDYHPGQARLQRLQQGLADKRQATAQLLGAELPATPLPSALSARG